jgi:hypothetical protein
VAYLYQSHMLVEGTPAELVARPDVTPAGMRRVEAECERGVAALMGHAQKLPYVHDVTIFGNALHLLIDAGVPDERIADDLRREACVAVAVRAITASLEDVFVRLTRLAAQRNGSAATHTPAAAAAARGGGG